MPSDLEEADNEIKIVPSRACPSCVSEYLHVVAGPLVIIGCGFGCDCGRGVGIGSSLL